MSHNRLSCGLQLSDRCYRNDEVLRTWPEKGKIRASSLMSSLSLVNQSRHDKSHHMRQAFLYQIVIVTGDRFVELSNVFIGNLASANYAFCDDVWILCRFLNYSKRASSAIRKGILRVCAVCIYIYAHNEGKLSRKPAKHSSRCFGFPSNCPLACVTAEIYAIGQKCIFSFLLVFRLKLNYGCAPFFRFWFPSAVPGVNFDIVLDEDLRQNGFVTFVCDIALHILCCS